jgi:hypothetical protein
LSCAICPLPRPAQAQALGCLAKLASADPALLGAIMGSGGIVDSVVASCQHGGSEPVQAAADAVLQALSASGEAAATKVVEAGAVACMVQQLERGSPLVSVAGARGRARAGCEQACSQLALSVPLLVAVVSCASWLAV